MFFTVHNQQCDAEFVDYEYLDLNNITTPVKVQQLERMLRDTEYPKSKADYLINGFRFGFDIRYQGPERRKDHAANLPFRVGTKLDMWMKIMKEVKHHRYVGPFTEIPFEFYVQSPVGLVLKAQDQTRLIFHLSHDFKLSGNKSVNGCTPKELCTVKYKDLDDAVRKSLALMKLIENSTNAMIWYSKTDIKSAFRLVPLRPSVFWLLVLKAEHPESGRMLYFVDKCLPFGHSMSCVIFQSFSDALAHIHRVLTRKISPVDTDTNYLDDFLFAAVSQFLCNNLMDIFLNICEKLGVPISPEKTEKATTILVFLGILLDGRYKILAVPEEKSIRAINQLNALLDRKKATVKELESLAGLLNFLHKAVVPGRAFTRRMYAKFSGKETSLNDSRNTSIPMERNVKISQQSKLMSHHHVRLDSEFKSDCRMWVEFLSAANNRVGISRPFVDLNETLTATSLDLFTDAAKGEHLGMGGVFSSRWFFAQWEPGFIARHDPSIEYLELLGVCMAVFIWTKFIKNSPVMG